MDYYHRFHLSEDVSRKTTSYSNWVQKSVTRRLRYTFANSRRSVKVPEVDMLLTNKYGCNFKPGVSLSNKDLIVEMTEKTEYEQSLFHLVRRA